MNKQIINLLIATLSFSSFNAAANSENFEGALEKEICEKCIASDIADGKIEASIMVQMSLLVQDGEKILNDLIQLEESVGQSAENTHGLIKYLGEREFFAQEALDEMRKIQLKSEHMNSEELNKATTKMRKLLRKMIQENEAAQRTANKLFFGSK